MYYKLWNMGRTRLTNQLDSVDESDLLKRLHPDASSAGWLLRHIAEVEDVKILNGVFSVDHFHIHIKYQPRIAIS